MTVLHVTKEDQWPSFFWTWNWIWNTCMAGQQPGREPCWETLGLPSSQKWERKPCFVLVSLRIKSERLTMSRLFERCPGVQGYAHRETCARRKIKRRQIFPLPFSSPLLQFPFSPSTSPSLPVPHHILSFPPLRLEDLEEPGRQTYFGAL